MRSSRVRRAWLLFIAAITAVAFLFSARKGDLSEESIYALSSPSFVQAADATSGNSAIAIIQDEAGISAYFEATSTVTISSVSSAFQTIEIQTADYILGTVALANYPEDHAPHVYVHKDGWFLAYYLDTDPVAKIIDWNAYGASGDTNISTKLESVLAIVAGAAGVGIPSITHYDFRYPNATNMMLIAERDQGTNNDYFTVNIPSSFGVSERSWSMQIIVGWSGSIILNGVTLHSGGGGYPSGTISAAQMPANTTHTVVITGGGNDIPVGGIALIYTE